MSVDSSLVLYFCS